MAEPQKVDNTPDPHLAPQPDKAAHAMIRELKASILETNSVTGLKQLEGEIRQRLIDQPGIPVSERNALTTALALATQRRMVLTGQEPEDSQLPINEQSGSAELGERPGITDEQLATLPEDHQALIDHNRQHWERDAAASDWQRQMLAKGLPVQLVTSAGQAHREHGTTLPTEQELRKQASTNRLD